MGASGADVRRWQYFLIGQGLLDGIADGKFGPATKTASIEFQRLRGLQPDGIVGNKTIGAAMLLGFGVLDDAAKNKASPNWPPKPRFSALNNAGREKLFGKFRYRHTPVAGNRENITVLDGWAAQNIITVQVPQLTAIKGSPRVQWHRKADAQLVQLWKDWESAGMLHLVLTWAGSYVPRLIRGSKTTLSNHAFGTAFDINVAWNMLGAVPALAGQKGSVRELVEIAHANGFYWGGHFTRQDGMHFEVAVVK
jgi:hypothetical protein